MPLTLASIYAPNSDQIEFLKSTFEALFEFRKGELFLGGDFNLILNNIMDTTGIRRHTRIPSARIRTTRFKNLLDSYNLANIWRFLHPLVRQYTFFSHTHLTHSRIDYLIGSQNLLQSCESVEIGNKTLSDHAWVACSFLKSG